jgi:hypothetical protein
MLQLSSLSLCHLPIFDETDATFDENFLKNQYIKTYRMLLFNPRQTPSFRLYN